MQWVFFCHAPHGAGLASSCATRRTHDSLEPLYPDNAFRNWHRGGASTVQVWWQAQAWEKLQMQGQVKVQIVVGKQSQVEVGFFFFFFFFFNLTYSRWTSSLPSFLWSQRIFPSLPGSRLTIFYCDASSALLQLVNQWL